MLATLAVRKTTLVKEYDRSQKATSISTSVTLTRAVETLATTRRLVVGALSKSSFPSFSAQQNASAAPSRLIKIDHLTCISPGVSKMEQSTGVARSNV